MISLYNIGKTFGSQVLFEDSCLQINMGDRFALVGPNGAGKSTLLRMILGEIEPDEGNIQTKKYISIGYMPQETAPVTELSVLNETLAICRSVDGRIEAKAKEILMGLGFKISDFDRSVKTLSGGWAMRVVLARLLLQQPDILLLDEPTNHLDISSVKWLEHWLCRCSSAVLVISHDRHFINSVCNAIISLENKMLKFYNGNYEFFVKESAAARIRLESAYKQQKQEIKDLKEFINRNRARLSTASRAQSAIKKLEKIKPICVPPDPKSVRINFPQPSRAGRRVLSAKKISKSYGDIKVYQNLNFELERGQKIAFVGENGAGKSTLLKLLAGIEKADNGEITYGLDVKVGYYSQHRATMLNPNKTVLQEAMDNTRMHPELTVRIILGAFLFSGDSVFKKTKVLSGGEKSRLALVKLLLDPPNVLLLDEPTIHLDLNSVDSLIAALKAYTGTICIISHDIYFINSLCDYTIHVDKGTLKTYHGNYDYFLSRQEQMEENSSQVVRASLSNARNQSIKLLDAKNRGKQHNIEKNRKKAEKEIEKAKEQVNILTKQLEDPSNHNNYKHIQTIGKEISVLNKLIEQKEALLLELLD
ncbi:MAG TPA: ABC-F family ATP-binding cassette domain-containing protein [Elusimicrobiales bacterium]|nr:ABC-F family ATP-binding cassette domain-containing protein [Elusimicrobiales bacterium]